MSQDRRAATYDALSRWYSMLADPSEGPLRRECLNLLRLRPGEMVLEVGSGPGMDLPLMARAVGEAGRVWGLDLSRGMLRACRRDRSKDPPGLPIGLVQGDGLHLPFRDSTVDVVLLSFTLELFGETQIPQVLEESARVTRPEGRLGIVSLSDRDPGGLATRLYGKAHRLLPGLVDCRPIDAGRAVGAGRYSVTRETARRIWGLWVSIVVARRN